MEIEQWLNDETAIGKSKKTYAHFDGRTDLSKCKQYISDPDKVASHSFYPFIHYVKNFTRYNKAEGKKPKERDIRYAAHIDRCIYQLYSQILNEKYNQRVQADGLAKVAVAYRTNLGENNVHFAKRAFDFIKASKDCYVMIGDFTSFFDKLDHNYLKKQWCDLLGVEKLPDDHYAVFKSLTKYNSWERNDLLKINGLKDTKKDLKKLNEQARVLTPQQYKANRHQIQKNPDDFGIPQGSPISGLLANVYMLEADKQINQEVTQHKGLYMRYSDDFIVVIPNADIVAAQEVIKKVKAILGQTKNLMLKPEKTQYFFYSQGRITDCGERFGVESDRPKKMINFLGFSFDGKKGSIRAKTTGKYYYRMYRKAKHIARCNGYTPKGQHISCKNLYQKYSERGKNPQSWGPKKDKRPKGNFLTYVDNAERIFGKSEDITRTTKHHMEKIRKALKSKQ